MQIVQRTHHTPESVRHTHKTGEFEYNGWFVISLSVLSWTQEKRMDELNLFIEYYSKYIVSIIWQRYVLTLHLSHANCCKDANE